MLLEFQIENYKSFVQNTVFSMHPAPKQMELNYSILREMHGSRGVSALCSSVVYGPNASGKTSVIGALDVLQSIVSRGHIRNVATANSPNAAAARLELIPNSALKEAKPVCFSIVFFERGQEVQYSLKLGLGLFNDADARREILEERLIINRKEVFLRHGNAIEINEAALNSGFDIASFAKPSKDLIATMQRNLNPEELFLTGGFKSSVSREVAELVVNWFTQKLQVVYQAHLLSLLPELPEKKTGEFYVYETISKVAQSLGIGDNELGYTYDEVRKRPRLSSIINEHTMLPANIYESLGTIRFINIFPILAGILYNGGTLLIDEFDASIHPMALISIINIFHNDEINKKHAQLIFNTHNPIFLNRNLFRRDEIKFVDRDDSTHESELYSLADFGTSGKDGVRKCDDYMKNYFVNRYGAIKSLDFSQFFKADATETK